MIYMSIIRSITDNNVWLIFSNKFDDFILTIFIILDKTIFHTQIEPEIYTKNFRCFISFLFSFFS